MKDVENLKAGEQTEISKGNGITVHAERTGCGKFLKFVRTFENGSFVVFHKVRF